MAARSADFTPDVFPEMTSLGQQSRLTLEERLGHRFRDGELLTRALTHMSAVAGDRVGTHSYQRLEFVGDRVLGLVVADLLYRRFPGEDEGALAKRFNALVRRETCAAVATGLDLGTATYLGKSERGSGGRHKVAILADIAESVTAAVYLDGGFDAAFAFVARHWGPYLDAAPETAARLADAKTVLQEWAQARGHPPPAYEVVERSGPDHAPRFVVRASVSSLEPALGEGGNKREGEQAAAAAILAREGITP